MNGIIYMYTSPSGKSYIGQTWNEAARKRDHRINKSYCGGSLLHKAIVKYGYKNIIYCILHSGIENQEELNQLEQEDIRYRNTMAPNGYNLSSGGSNGCSFSEQSKKKISDSLIGHTVPEDVREKIRSKLIGKSYVSPEGREKISKRHKGRILNDSQLECLKKGREKPRSEQAMEASKKALIEYVLTDEDRRKKSERTTGNKNPFYGKKHTEETKKKISETKRKNKENERT